MNEKIDRKIVKKPRLRSISVWVWSVISADGQRLGDVGVERGLDALGQHLVGDRAVALDQHGVDEAGLGDELHRRRRVEQRPRRVARRDDVVVRGDADERERRATRRRR